MPIMPPIASEHYGWLTTCPPGDVNFKSHLKDADTATLRAALRHHRGKPHTKTVCAVIEREIKRREKEDRP